MFGSSDCPALRRIGRDLRRMERDIIREISIAEEIIADEPRRLRELIADAEREALARAGFLAPGTFPADGLPDPRGRARPQGIPPRRLPSIIRHRRMVAGLGSIAVLLVLLALLILWALSLIR